MGASPSLRVVFLGNDPWSVPSLEALAASSHEVVLVATRGPRPARRGGPPTPTPVARAAERLGLPLLEVGTLRSGEGYEAVGSARPDVLAVVSYGELLPDEVLALAGVGPVNLHFSLLPSLRGASPVQTALLLGLPVTGVTTFLMDSGLDTGSLLLQAEEPVRDDDDAGSLGDRLARVGAGLLARTLDRLAKGDLVPRPQEGRLATSAPKLGPDDRRLDWTAEAPALALRVRALAPEPGAVTRFRGEVVKVLRCEALAAHGSPGEVVAVAKDGFVVAAGRGAIRPLEVAPAGRKRMSGAEFVRGFRPREGDRFG